MASRAGRRAKRPGGSTARCYWRVYYGNGQPWDTHRRYNSRLTDVSGRVVKRVVAG
jgi:hypothetical protein